MAGGTSSARRTITCALTTTAADITPAARSSATKVVPQPPTSPATAKAKKITALVPHEARRRRQTTACAARSRCVRWGLVSTSRRLSGSCASFVPLAAHSSQDPQPNASYQSDGDQFGADFERGQVPAALAITTITAAAHPAKGNCLIRTQAHR